MSGDDLTPMLDLARLLDAHTAILREAMRKEDALLQSWPPSPKDVESNE